MNNKPNNQPSKTKYLDLSGQNILKVDDEEDGGVVEFVESLNSVNQNSADAKLNATTISDNNGGRIVLGEDGQNIVKK